MRNLVVFFFAGLCMGILLGLLIVCSFPPCVS